jgi:hypothetical protein
MLRRPPCVTNSFTLGWAVEESNYWTSTYRKSTFNFSVTFLKTETLRETRRTEHCISPWNLFKLAASLADVYPAGCKRKQVQSESGKARQMTSEAVKFKMNQRVLWKI